MCVYVCICVYIYMYIYIQIVDASSFDTQVRACHGLRRGWRGAAADAPLLRTAAGLKEGLQFVRVLTLYEYAYVYVYT